MRTGLQNGAYHQGERKGIEVEGTLTMKEVDILVEGVVLESCANEI